MKYLVLAAALAAAGTVCAAPVDSCVRVVAYVGEDVDNPGSGTVVASSRGKSLVLTNRHVVSERGVPFSEIEYDVFAKGNVYEARLKAWSKTDDLALLEVDADLPVAKVADKAPEFGQTVYEWGFPRGRRQKAQSGPYQQYDGVYRNEMHWGGYRPGVKTYQGEHGPEYAGGVVQAVGVPGTRGKSGAGVFNKAGELVGVVWGGKGRDVVVGYQEVVDFLREHLAGK